MAFETESEKFDLRARARAQLKSFKCARAQLKSLKCARARSYLFELEKFRRFPSQCHLGNIKKEKKRNMILPLARRQSISLVKLLNLNMKLSPQEKKKRKKHGEPSTADEFEIRLNCLNLL